MPKLGRSLGVAGLPNRLSEYIFSVFTGPSGRVFTSPSEIGSAVTVEQVSPFLGGYSYSFTESVNSYLKFNYDQSWSVGTDDFTIEWFSNQNSTRSPLYQRVFTIDDYAGSGDSIDLGVSIEDARFYYWIANTHRNNFTSATTNNTWYHFAVVRSSGVTKIYRDGILLTGANGSQIADTFNVTNPDQLPLVIGNTTTYATNAAFNGYITNFRWVKGLAVYTGNFTRPTSNLTLIAGANPYGGSNTQAIPAGYTKLLLVPTPIVTSRLITDLDQNLITDDSKYIIYGT